MGLCLWILSQKMNMANRFKAFAVDLLRPTPASDDAVELEAPAQPAGRDDHVDPEAPAQPVRGDAVDPEAPAQAAGLGVEQRKMEWTKNMVAFCLASAIALALLPVQVHSQLPTGLLCLSLAILLGFSSFFLLLLLTLLPLTLAGLAFLLQWRRGITDPSTRCLLFSNGFCSHPRCCRWAGLVDFVLGCGFCAVGLSGLRGGSWWVSVGGLARSGSGWVAGCFLVGLWGGSRSALGGSEMSVSFVEHLEDNANHSSSPPSATVSIDLSGLYNPPVSELLNGRAFSSEQHLKGIIKFCGGPILIAEYMEEVLTNPKAGFYINRDVFGTEMVGVWAMCLWEQMGQPNKVNLVELGPGLGTLMADLLRDASKFKCFTGSLHIHMVECSPTLQKFQHSNLKCKDEDTNDKFNKRSVSTLARTPVTWHAALEQGDDLVVGVAKDPLPLHVVGLSSDIPHYYLVASYAIWECPGLSGLGP
uniref:Protein arginine methyltransferase NDUFAF7 n=1 Tax=Fagus sylvatica TaxID=28930 RepID=A0A2N9HIM5_FAGSY